MNLLYAEITKAEQRIVEGIASTEALDQQAGTWEGHAYAGDVVDVGAIEDALPDYLKWANIREMHEPSAVGTALSAEVVDGKLRLVVKVVDDSAWDKVREKVYKGFSIGGKVLKAVLEKLPDGTYIRRILKLMLTEISLVDRPANPDARIVLFKMEAPMPAVNTETPDKQDASAALDAETVATLLKLAGQAQPAAALAKAGSTDPTKIVAQIQQWRNEFEINADMDAAAMLTQVISIIQQVVGDAESPAEAAAEEAADDATVAADASTDEAAMVAQGATATLKKGTRIRTTKRVGGVEALAKSLLQLAADMGSAWAAKVMQMASSQPTDVAAAIGAEFTKAITPIAGAVLNINDRMITLERQPAPGGPALRRVEKVIAGQQTVTEKPAITALVKMQLDSLSHLARTAATPGMRDDYKRQHDALQAQYQ